MLSHYKKLHVATCEEQIKKETKIKRIAEKEQQRRRRFRRSFRLWGKGGEKNAETKDGGKERSAKFFSPMQRG